MVGISQESERNLQLQIQKNQFQQNKLMNQNNFVHSQNYKRNFINNYNKHQYIGNNSQIKIKSQSIEEFKNQLESGGDFSNNNKIMNNMQNIF